MKNKLFYILGLSTAMLSSCHDDDMADMFLNGKEKTPLPVSVSLDTRGSVQTRAANMEFSAGDELLVYIQHVAPNNEDKISSVDADMAPALVKFKVKPGVSMAPVDDPTTIQETSDLELMSILHKGVGGDLMQSGQTTLFWDDFSDSTSDETDLRTSGHGLRPLYGYCYNGGDPTTPLDPVAGTLGWTVDTDQTSGIKTNDLLWSGTPDSYVSYNHNNPASVGLRIPYTHAMSKVTVVLVAGKGFEDDDMDGSKITLKGMNTVCSVDAAHSELCKDQITNFSAEETIKDITMYKHSDHGSITVAGATKPTRSFEAIVVPNKVWAKDNAIATITGMDGNTYNITATQSIISQFLHGTTNEYQTDETVTLEPGKNYKLTITVDKQPQNIVAEITDWDNIKATGVGTIQFAADVVSHNMTTDNVQGSFDLWRSSATTPVHDSFDEDGNASNGVTKATTVTYSGGKWTNSPEIYWANGSQNYYFRALAKFVQVEEQKQIISNEDISLFDVTQGTDIVWGTTSEHTGNYIDADGNSQTKVYAEGAAINPRTGTVPMTFKHAMSKISVNLQNAEGIEDAAKVNLVGAKISIANIYDKGIIALNDGAIGSLTATEYIPIKGLLAANDATTGTKLNEVVVVPQYLTTMADGTTSRTGNVSFYNKNELLTIEDRSYAISTLDAISYDESGANTYNKTLPGCVNAGNTKYYTYEEFKALTNDQISEQLFNLLDLGFGYDEFLATLPLYTPFRYYTKQQYESLLSSTLLVNGTHTEESANAYNATLPGAVKAGDFKGYAVKSTSKEARPGDIKTNGTNPKIVMLIMLADGSTYTVDLASCQTNTGTNESPNWEYIVEWKRGKHYTYTISLQKEKISFRAMIKEWEEKTSSGNATLEWD